VTELREREKLDAVKKDATNAFNRHNNKTCKTFAAFYSEQNLPARTIVNIDGTEFMWATSESREIDPRQWYKLWQDGEITDDQYFECLSIGKKKASLIIGEDQVETISIDKQGSDADIRRDASNAGTVKGISVITPEPIRKPVGIKPRTVAATPVQAPAPKRKVVVGK
jgi:hypothetical protein